MNKKTRSQRVATRHIRVLYLYMYRLGIICLLTFICLTGTNAARGEIIAPTSSPKLTSERSVKYLKKKIIIIIITQ